MGNQTEIDRINELSGIIHNCRGVYGKDYSDCFYRNSTHPATVEIGKEPAYSSKERKNAIRELKRLNRHSLDEKVRKMAVQELKRPNNFTDWERKNRNFHDFEKAHPILDMCGFMVFSWIMIGGGVAFIYGAARLYNYLIR